jgi:hypothetical protein
MVIATADGRPRLLASGVTLYTSVAPSLLVALLSDVLTVGPTITASQGSPVHELRNLGRSGSGGRTRTYDQAVNSRPLYH